MKPQMTNRLYVGLQKHILLLDLQRYERIPDRDTSVFGEIPSISAASLTVIYSLFVCIPRLDYFIVADPSALPNRRSQRLPS
jgi:hypothetical protein